MAATLVRKVMLKIAADDGDTESKLDKISEKARELAAQHPDLAVKIDTAAASAKLAVLRKELKQTDDQSASLKTRFAEVGQALNNGLLGGISLHMGEMSMFQKVMAGLNLATGLAEPLVAGLTVAAGGLAAGLASAGLGAGVFGLAAESAFSQVTAANTAGVKLTGGLGEMQRELATATGAWSGFGKAASPGVARVMAGALGLIPKALALAQPFLAPTEAALGRITGMLGKAASSSGAKSWFGAFAASSGTDLTKVAVAVGRIATGLGGLLKAFLPVSGSMLSGLDKITAKFAAWGTTLTGHSGFQSLMTMFRQDTPTVLGLLKNLAGIIKTVVGEMTGMDTVSNSRTLIQVAEAVSGLVNSLLKAHPQLVELYFYLKMTTDTSKKLASGIRGVSDSVTALKDGKKAVSDFAAGFGSAEKAADEATGAAGTWGGKMSAVFGSVKSAALQAAQRIGLVKTATVEATEATEGEEGAQEGLNVVMSMNPIGLVVIAIAALVIAIVELWKHSAAFRDFWKAAWKDIQAVAVAAWHLIDNDAIRPLVSGIGKAVSFVAAQWAEFRRVTSELADDVTGFFKRLPGRIMGALAALPGLMLSAGRNIVSMLASGIENMAMAPVNALKSIVSDVRDLLPFSPARKGPLSGSGSPDIAGRKIATMLASGMEGGAAMVASASARVARAAQIGAAGHPAPAGAGGYGGAQRLQLEWTGGGGDQALITLLKNHIRIKGGDPNVLGR